MFIGHSSLKSQEVINLITSGITCSMGEYNFLLRSTYPYVSNLMEISQVAVTYCTDKDLFTPIEDNRGEKDGVEEKRVKSINKLKDGNIYFKGMEKITVNLFGEIVNGHHRYTSALRRGEVFLVELTLDPAMNTRNRTDLKNNISILNNHNSKWTGNTNFLSAFIANEPLAVKLNADYLSPMNIGVNGKPILNVKEILHIYTECDNYRDNKSFTRSAYCKSELIDVIEESRNAEIIQIAFALARELDRLGYGRKGNLLREFYSVIKAGNRDLYILLSLFLKRIESYTIHTTKQSISILGEQPKPVRERIAKELLVYVETKK